MFLISFASKVLALEGEREQFDIPAHIFSTRTQDVFLFSEVLSIRVSFLVTLSIRLWSRFTSEGTSFVIGSDILKSKLPKKSPKDKIELNQAKTLFLSILALLSSSVFDSASERASSILEVILSIFTKYSVSTGAGLSDILQDPPFSSAES